MAVLDFEFEPHEIAPLKTKSSFFGGDFGSKRKCRKTVDAGKFVPVHESQNVILREPIGD
jgi:hypothetical protein